MVFTLYLVCFIKAKNGKMRIIRTKPLCCVQIFRCLSVNSSKITFCPSLYTYSSYNGQSRLLQAVRSALKEAYPRSDIKADGQVVKIDFSDGMKFEILPAFKQVSLGYGWGSFFQSAYTYPDSNMGGNWKSTNPKAEQEAMKVKNQSTKGLLFDTCKHIRYIRDNFFSSYHLSLTICRERTSLPLPII